MKSIIIKPFIIIAVLIILVTSCMVACTDDTDNEFTSNVNSSDFDFIYDDSDGQTIKTIIVPKYDFVDFSYKLEYNGKGLLNSYEKQIDVGKVNAGTQLLHSELISDIESNINGDYFYTDVLTLSGKKQQKYSNTENQLNTELDFLSIIIKDRGGYYFTFHIKNNTNYYVKEIRMFRISLQFNDDISCKFYNPRIVLDSPLAPHSTTTITNLTGSIHIGLGSYNIEEKKDAMRAGLTTSTYSDQTYQLVYDKLS